MEHEADQLENLTGIDLVTEPGTGSEQTQRQVEGPSGSLKDFFREDADLDNEVEMILMNPGLLTDEQLIDLHAILQDRLPAAVQYGADFDFTQEITAQITAIRALRRKVMNGNGTFKEEISPREAKEVISASSTLLQQIMKHHDKVQNFERQRAIEEATNEAIKTLDARGKRVYFDTLKTLLEGLGQKM